MKRTVAQMATLLPVLALALISTRAYGQELPKGKEKDAGAEKPAAKADPAVIAKLIQQLGSGDFKARDKASQALAKLDEVPNALRQATKSADAEVARRAQTAIAVITARVEEKAFQAMVRDLHKVELDRFVRRMVTEEKFAGDKQWGMIQAIAKAVTKEANKLGEPKFEVPDFNVKTMPRLLFHRETRNPVSVGNSVVLSAGPTPYITSVTNSLVIVDGDFTGATGIDNSLLIVRGNVGRVTSITKSIILATGNFEGATGCDYSFLQVNNQRIRFTTSRDCVLIKTMVKTTGDTTSRALDADRGPLQLLRFSPRKADDQLVWGKQVNNLAVAISPADQKDHFLIRWKNVGKDALELPWVRLNSSVVDKNRDDLLNHVFLKGPDGKLAPARKHPAERAGGAPFLGRSVVLGPDQTHEETIDLWTYVDRVAADARYQLSIELDIPSGRKGLEWEVKSWSGKVQSNVLEVMFGK
jgi:hypothetical protein